MFIPGHSSLIRFLSPCQALYAFHCIVTAQDPVLKMASVEVYIDAHSTTKFVPGDRRPLTTRVTGNLDPNNFQHQQKSRSARKVKGILPIAVKRKVVR
jgi:hypothetical protein